MLYADDSVHELGDQRADIPGPLAPIVRTATLLERAYRAACVVLEPVERFCVKRRIGPTTLTLGSLVASAAAATCVVLGRFRSAATLYLGAGALDLLDGRIARETRATSPRGAALDSIVDRVSEISVLSAVVWRARRRSTSTMASGLLAASMMVSYVRARGEGLGLNVASGLMVRGPRLIGLSTLFFLESSLPRRQGRGVLVRTAAESRVFTFGLFVLAMATSLTAIQRTRVVLLGLKGPVEHRPQSRARTESSSLRSAIHDGQTTPEVVTNSTDHHLGG